LASKASSDDEALRYIANAKNHCVSLGQSVRAQGREDLFEGTQALLQSIFDQKADLAFQKTKVQTDLKEALDQNPLLASFLAQIEQENPDQEVRFRTVDISYSPTTDNAAYPEESPFSLLDPFTDSYSPGTSVNMGRHFLIETDDKAYLLISFPVKQAWENPHFDLVQSPDLKSLFGRTDQIYHLEPPSFTQVSVLTPLKDGESSLLPAHRSVPQLIRLDSFKKANYPTEKQRVSFDLKNPGLQSKLFEGRNSLFSFSNDSNIVDLNSLESVDLGFTKEIPEAIPLVAPANFLTSARLPFSLQARLKSHTPANDALIRQTSFDLDGYFQAIDQLFALDSKETHSQESIGFGAGPATAIAQVIAATVLGMPGNETQAPNLSETATKNWNQYINLKAKIDIYAHPNHQQYQNALAKIDAAFEILDSLYLEAKNSNHLDQIKQIDEARSELWLISSGVHVVLQNPDRAKTAALIAAGARRDYKSKNGRYLDISPTSKIKGFSLYSQAKLIGVESDDIDTFRKIALELEKNIFNIKTLDDDGEEISTVKDLIERIGEVQMEGDQILTYSQSEAELVAELYPAFLQLLKISAHGRLEDRTNRYFDLAQGYSSQKFNFQARMEMAFAVIEFDAEKSIGILNGLLGESVDKSTDEGAQKILDDLKKTIQENTAFKEVLDAQGFINPKMADHFRAALWATVHEMSNTTTTQAIAIGAPTLIGACLLAGPMGWAAGTAISIGVGIAAILNWGYNIYSGSERIANAYNSGLDHVSSTQATVDLFTLGIDALDFLPFMWGTGSALKQGTKTLFKETSIKYAEKSLIKDTGKDWLGLHFRRKLVFVGLDSTAKIPRFFRWTLAPSIRSASKAFRQNVTHWDRYYRGVYGGAFRRGRFGRRISLNPIRQPIKTQMGRGFWSASRFVLHYGAPPVLAYSEWWASPSKDHEMGIIGTEEKDRREWQGIGDNLQRAANRSVLHKVLRGLILRK
jgi:hypothetical protein